MNAEFQTALESVEKANSIYPGTVEGFVFSQNDIDSSLGRAKQTLAEIRNLRRSIGYTNLRIGSRQKCYGLTSFDPEDDSSGGKLLLTRRQIVNESDFIICTIEPAQHNLPSGAEAGFVTVKNDLLGYMTDLKTINPNLEVMGQTGWPSKGDKKWENLTNQEKYWQICDKWAGEHNFTMWMLEAFDNPWKDWVPNAAHYGWWWLKKNAQTGQISGYGEKVKDPPNYVDENAPAEASVWVYVGVGLGVALLAIILFAVAMLYFRVQKLQDALTNEDVKEFMYGMSEEAAAQQGGEAVNALTFPYDKSFEIPKEALKIRKDLLLGSGQFGCVYRALIENEKQTEVALKMAKHDCPKSALVGLLSEIKILTYLGKHPNIVSIEGAYTAELIKGIVYVATELCPLGSLESYLRDKQVDNQSQQTDQRYANAPRMVSTYGNVEETELGSRPEITYLDMVRWSHEIACGMEYLGTKHVIHADLATSNVLLAADKTAKITDFGLSRRLYDYTNYVKKQQEPLPWRWMAIESLKRLEFSPKSDVWSYGVTLWEIFALGDLPYPGLSWNLDFVDSLVNGLRMKSPPHATQEMYEIMVSCWHSDPKERPGFTDLKVSTGNAIHSGSSNPVPSQEA